MGFGASFHQGGVQQVNNGSITPEVMATIYFKRLHFSGLSEIRERLKNYQDCEGTQRYWLRVLAKFETFLPARTQAEAPHV